jgi:hypothetical protein
MADFSLNRKSLIVLILAGFVILKMYLNNDILQTDVDILLKKTMSLQKEIKRLNAEMDLIKIEQKSASSDFAQPRRQEAADSASTNNPNNKVMDMIVDDLVNNINIFLKLNDSNATLLARLVLASLKIKVKFRFLGGSPFFLKSIFGGSPRISFAFSLTHSLTHSLTDR